MNTKIIIGLVIAIVGFFLFNNILHAGIHIGHTHHTIDEHEDDTDTKAHEIRPRDVVEKIKSKEDIILLDVRTLREYEEIHLENALLLPVEELSAKALTDIGLGDAEKDREIIIYCRSGARSTQAHALMNSLGYTNVTSMAGGMIHWQEDNYPFTEIGEYTPEDIKASMEVAGPILSFDRTLHDFGSIPMTGGTVETTFELTNTGVQPLIIGEISASCGCTSAEISETTIDPQETAILTVVFDPAFHAEPLDKITRTVFIPTNDPTMPEAEVNIKVDILEKS